MSPILVRPVREQLEHDRVIRLLQQDLAKKKVEVGINPGAEQNASVGGGARKEFPDAVLFSTDKGRKLIGVVEVETAESVNHLEAMSQWAHLAKLRVPFHLYVPTGSADAARRLSEDHRIAVTEIWSYHQVGEQFKFTLIFPPARGRSAGTPPRTVSVASIRVEPRVDPTVGDVPDEPAARSASNKPVPAPSSAKPAARVASEPASPRVIPAKPRVIPSKAATVPAKAGVTSPAPKPSPVKLRPVVKAPPVAPAKPVVPAPAKTPKAPAKAAAAPAPKVKPAKVAPARLVASKAVGPKAATPAAKVVVSPAARAAGRPSAGRPPVQARKAASARKAPAPPPAAGRTSKAKQAASRKPAPKRR